MQIDWKKNPLVPAIAQEAESGEVLMLAYMNEEAYRLTLETGYAHYFSRSKQRVWKKGESSGHTQKVLDLLLDCDADTILLKVKQKGVACHTGRKSCFFTSVTQGKTVSEPEVDTAKLYGVVDTLYHTILERKASSGEKSWTKKLLDDKELLLSKIREEADELAVAIDRESDEQVIYEAADLLYHALVGLGARELSPDRVKQELARRFGMSGIEEKESRNKD
ncbi:bifunctional phosphoribosyl-AMP cyclohydrolase/phosphoribosyl-ATP diphosphatase HisIE [Nitratifractor salsuginis]|uniref:Histidine biosynthesis bifunctional protein HisIE n=1 Tax=Nitratifractor salsuginis (strain DSM 16511 / JCM 12458 / E9I37-1) TaxID=749222 RepID=E6X148_NITSE|nr:bifunctional phosphoribosyl-AMP cyclohydrolase/phosphoribosyl-ATP diphosphatase HisIE [Nitratifractor salsuginis]ADV45851.1 phosphoribosyl-AMP cyclohydrolase; phosphoribosyl-ATP pyrophosphatase [Nitratifractor salsuginis DSM 16511]